MIRVHDSNCFEELAAALAEALGPAVDPLAEHFVAVPSRAVAGRLEREIASRRGVAAGIRFGSLEALVAERIERGGGRRVLARERLHAQLLGLLADGDLLAAEDMGPVRSYLSPESGDGDESALRRFQLAEKLAGLFFDYTQHRPKMVATWRRGPTLEGTPQRATEIWQRRLYLAALEAGRLEPALAHLQELSPGELGFPERLHVVSLTPIAPGQAQLLARLAEESEIDVYTFNPSREHWDDLESGDAPALRLFGRPGAVHRRLLGELASWDFHSRFRDPIGGSTLAHLQRDVLACAPESALSSNPPDGSVKVLACPAVRRELEIVAAEIWELLRRDDDLRFDDIAILAAPAHYELYQAQLSAVFRELHGIPHQVLDLPLASKSRVARALDLLLDLPLGRFSRPELLRLVTHPVVAGRFSDVDTADWIRFTERLGIVHGADRGDHAETYIERDLYHWDQGLRRLALGGFMAGEPSGVKRTAVLGGSPLLPEEVSGDAERSAARFAVLCRSLIEDARDARGSVRSLADWALFFDLLATTYLCPLTDEDARDLQRCREALRGLADLVPKDFGGSLTYREVRELARRQLASLRGSRSEGEGGVTVAPLAPVRPLPFRVIFAVGLDEAAFPGEDRESPLDLRSAHRAPTDVGARERDRYLFLQTLMSARDRLYLSYVARDAHTGEQVSPSPVILELERILGADVTESFPLRRWESPPDADPVAQRQARCRELRLQLTEACSGGAEPPGREALLEAARAREPLARLLGLHPVAAPAPLEDDEREARPLSFSILRRFLECPLQAWAQAVLGLREQDFEDPIAREEEPFSTARGPEIGILREVLIECLLGGAAGEEELARAYRERAELEELGGRAPTGVFAAVEGERHLALLEAWRQRFHRLAGDAPAVSLRAFGRARRTETVSRPLEVEAGGLRFELSGETEAFADGGGGAPGSTFFVAAARPRDRHFLRGFLDGAVLAAAGLRAGVPHAATVIAGERAERRVFPAWSAEEARAYLGELARELTDKEHDYLLPCEAVFEARRRPERSLDRIVAGLLTGKGPGCSSAWGPIRRLDRLAPPAEERAAEIVERRFARFFAGEKVEELR